MKRATIITSLLCLQCATGFGVVISMVDAPRDDPEIVRDCNFLCNHQELQPLTENYNELLQVLFEPLQMKDIAAIFGAKLDQKPDGHVKPLFVPTMIMGSGLSSSAAPNKKHVDFHAIGNIGYLEVHYRYDGESVATAVIYFRADDKFVPVQSTNDIPRREAWDRAKYETLKKWLDDHLPKLTDLGVVTVSPSHPSRVDLGAEMACVITTRDIHTTDVPFWLSMDIVKETSAPPDFESLQLKSVSRPNEPVGFTIDAKFYRLTPKLVEQSHDSK